MAEWCTARVRSLSFAGIAGSNPAEGMDECIVCCTLKTEAVARTIKTKKQVEKKH
jgi:hypothetical protein